MGKNRLAALRRLMGNKGLSAYYIGSADPHQSEYVPDCWQRRAWLSGFTGSAGTVVITGEKAGLWTDGRYFIQAEKELKGSGISLFRDGIPGTPEWSAWLKSELRRGGRLGIDPSLMTVREAGKLSRNLAISGIEIAWLEENLVDLLWEDRPPLPHGKIVLHPIEYAGRSSSDKLDRVRAAMAEQNAQALVLIRLDSIAWLFNIRGSDVSFNPVALAYAILTPDEALIFSADPSPPSLSDHISGKARVLPYGDFQECLASLGKSGQNVWLDPGSASRGSMCWPARTYCAGRAPIPMLKAVKNREEMRGAKSAHIRDGAAMVRFFEWLGKAVPGEGHRDVSG